MTNRRRDYFFTLNNYEESDYEYIKQYIQDHTDYGLLCREVAPTTGTKHLHFYFYFSNKKEFNSLKKLFPRANIQAARGTPSQVYAYVTKTDTDFFEYGIMPKQGKRNDISTVLSSVQSGENMRQIIPNATSLQSIKIAEVCMKYFEPVRNFATKVYWYYGDSGCGKTYKAAQQFPNAYWKMAGKWWDGYDAHEDVIIDDMRPDDFPFSYLLTLLQSHPCRVEIKGGTRQFLAKNVVITAPYSPAEMYKHINEDVYQIVRRCHVIEKIFSQPIIEQEKNDASNIQEVVPKKRQALKRIKEIQQKARAISSAEALCIDG